MRLAVCALDGRGGHEAGWMLLEKLYREVTGEALPAIAFTKRGKPYFPGGTLHFSITHTRRHAFCVLASCPVGIDAEEADRPIPLRLADRILSPAEKAQLEHCGDPRAALLTFWVLKEAAAKCTGEGLHGFPNDTAFSLTDPRVRLWEGCFVAVITEGEEEGETIYAF